MDREERVTSRNIDSYRQNQLEPCSDCPLDKDDCGQRIAVSTPGKLSDVLCKMRGAIEIIDLSLQDKSRKHTVMEIGKETLADPTFVRVNRNGQSQTNREVPQDSAAVL